MRLHPQLNLSVENNYLLPRIVVFFLDYVKETFLVNIKHLIVSKVLVKATILQFLTKNVA